MLVLAERRGDVEAFVWLSSTLDTYGKFYARAVLDIFRPGGPCAGVVSDWFCDELLKAAQ